MKNYFVLLGALLVMIGCSQDSKNDSENSEDLSPASTELLFRTENAVLQYYYDQMLLSKSYIKFKDARELFLTNMDYNGDGSDLERDDKILLWIRTNIGSTNFTSYSAAEREWQDLEIMAIEMVAKNHLFFDELEASGDFEVFVPDGYTNQTNDNCTTKCNNAFHASNQLHIAAMREEMADWGYSDYGVGVAVRRYEMRLSANLSIRERCLGNC